MAKFHIPYVPYVLGIDLGSSSLGWALVSNEAGTPCRIIRAGVRCFQAGVEGDIEGGRDTSRAAARRMKRQPRRQLWRRGRRKAKLFNLLQKNGLIPSPAAKSSVERHELLLKLDALLRPEFLRADDLTDAHLLPYKLRAAAVERMIPLHAFGRALLHLNQRRGFNSGLKSVRKPDEDEGRVKSAISDLANELDGKTLGQLFSTFDPESRRIRKRWTSRQMYVDEFERMWATQAAHHAELTEDLKRHVFSTIFYQRPLKSQKGLVGWCSLERGKRRCRMALPIAQRFRLLQKVNDLVIFNRLSDSRKLSAQERQVILDSLDSQRSITFGAIRKLLKLPKESRFNFEEGGEKGLIGHKTNTTFSEVFGNRWFAFTDNERSKIILETLSYRNLDKLVERGRSAWDLPKERALLLSEMNLDDGYASHSQKALFRLVEEMERGSSYAEAKAVLYPNAQGSVYDSLPPIRRALRQLTNPAVIRALTELRKVVNAIIRRHGKPESVHIELARDLRRSRDERQRITKSNRDREKQRSKAVKRLLAEIQGCRPSVDLVEKVLLAEECNWECPYTGQTIAMSTLIGEHSQFDVEHIFPRKYLDNSFANKTLCYSDENRHHKKDQLPFQAYSRDHKRWEEIIERVSRFSGNAAREKLRRFWAEEVPEEFSSRQLNDTRYNSRLAADYLGLLFGGRIDSAGEQKVFTITGGLTALLRSQWRLYTILGSAGDKGRHDHRNHAIDAIVIALACRPIVYALQSVISSEYLKRGPKLDTPWPGLLDDVRHQIEQIIVSHRVNRKLSGALHEESLYGQTNQNGTRTISDVTISKELSKLSKREIESDLIVDPVIRVAVQSKFKDLGGEPSKVFANIENHPFLEDRNKRRIPIHKVKVRMVKSTVAIGSPEKGNQRHVVTGSNYATFIVSDGDPQESKWRDIPISLLDAAKQLASRDRKGFVTIRPPSLPEMSKVMFGLMIDDCIEADDKEGKRAIYRVMNVSAGDIQLQLHSDARDSKTLIAEKARIRVSGDKLRKLKAVKVDVGPLGDVVKMTSPEV